MTIQHVIRVRQLLEHVNTDRWGTAGRNAEALQLVAAIAGAPPCLAVIKTSHFTELGRDRRQARYDREEVLPRLVADRVLIRQGRAFGISDDLAHWLRVPGLPSWRCVVSLFSGRLFGEAARESAKIAAHAALGMPYLPGIWDSPLDPLSVEDLAVRARDMGDRARSPGQTPPDDRGSRAAAGAAHNSSELLSPSLSNSPPQEVREGGPGNQMLTMELAKAIAAAIGCAVTGSNLTKLRALVEPHPERFDELLALTARLQGYRTAVGAVDALVQLAGHAPRPVVPVVDPAKRIANLRQRIANLQAYTPDDERLPELEAELAELESPLTDTEAI